MADQSLIVGYIHNGDLKARFVRSLLTFMAYDAAHRQTIKQLPYECESCDIVANRNRVVQNFLEKSGGAEWLLFVDTDIVFTPEHVYQLLDAAHRETAPMVSGLYHGFLSPDYPWPLPFAFDVTDNGEFRSVIQIDTGMQRVMGFGMGFCLINRGLLEKVAEAHKANPWRWFGRDSATIGGLPTYLGEDLTLCKRASDLGFPLYLHAGVRVGHLKSQLITFDSFVEGHETYLKKRAARTGDVTSLEVLVQPEQR